MKLLVFSAYYEPEIAASLYLSTNLYEDMAAFGWEIDLFVPMPTRGVDNKTRRKYKKNKLELKYDGKLKIHRVSMMKERENTFLRAFRYLILNLAFIWKGLFKKTNLIFVQSTPPTQGAMAALLKKLKRVPLIYNLQDVFPDSLVNTGLTKKGSIIWRIGRMIENFTYRNTDKIIVISKDFKQNIIDKGVPEDKIEVIYNWVDEKAVVPVNKSENILYDKYGLDKNKFYITYCGNIGFTQNLDMLVDVAKRLEEYKNIQFILIGDGAYKAKLKCLISERNVSNIKLLPFQPYKDISHVFSLGDIGLILSKANVGQNSFPSKTWSIMSAERFVLASFDMKSELNSIILEADCGICVPPDDKEAFKNAIVELYNNRAMLVEKGRNGRRYILKNLTREKGTSKYIETIKKVFDNNQYNNINRGV